MPEDQRGYLKIKIKSLAEEARIIRREEQRCFRVMTHCGISEEKAQAKQNGLWYHRTHVVRRAARHALLAYGFIRGRKYRQIEAKCERPPEWEEVKRMVLKYGLGDYGKHFWLRNERKQAEEEILKRFNEWRTEV